MKFSRRDIVIYIAGPYRADTWGKVKQNVAAAMDVAAELLHAGYTVICPHSMTHEFEMYGLPDEVFLDSDLRLIGRCDAILMLPNWRASTGSIAEHHQAQDNGMRIFEWAPNVGRQSLYMDIDAAFLGGDPA